MELISNNFTGVLVNIVSFLFELSENRQRNQGGVCAAGSWTGSVVPGASLEPAEVLGRGGESAAVGKPSRLVKHWETSVMSEVQQEPTEQSVNIHGNFPQSKHMNK